MSSQANISDTPFDQKSPGHPEVDVLNCHRQTDRHTYGHGDSMTESAQLANSIKTQRQENMSKTNKSLGPQSRGSS